MFGSAPGMTSRRGSLVLTSLTSALPFVPERAACGFGVISTVLVLWTHQLSLTFRSLLYFIFPDVTGHVLFHLHALGPDLHGQGLVHVLLRVLELT